MENENVNYNNDMINNIELNFNDNEINKIINSEKDKNELKKVYEKYKENFERIYNHT